VSADLASPVAAHPVTLLLGKESVGKSALVHALTGRRPTSTNFRGSTVDCEEYLADGRRYVDTPGLHRESDADSVRRTLSRLEASDEVLLVVQATHFDEDLEALLPLVQGKRASIAVTFWDHVEDTPGAREAVARVALELGLPFVCVDGRHPTADSIAALRAGLSAPGVVRHERPSQRAGWRMEPRRTLIDHRILGPISAAFLLLVPAVIAVLAANAVAGWLEPIVDGLLTPLAERLGSLPGPLAAVLAGDYGLVTMGPLLFVWAVPTVVVYALMIGAYKASGLVDRIGTALHPLLRPVGLHGRDVTRVLMGFGCNVPAVLSTRSCSACSRPAAVGAIAFGAACSYQLGATLAVFAAAGRGGLVVPYLVILVIATLVYTRLTSTAEARSPLNVLLVERRTFLVWPQWRAVWREAGSTIAEFFRKALPVFFAISAVASLLAWAGVLDAAAGWVSPAMALLALPPDAALPVILAGIRKDGILLLAEDGLAGSMTSAQILASVFLAGTLMPCLVTALTVGRELGLRFTGALVARQALMSIAVSLLIAWGGIAVAGWWS
jgi:ferrous iron transport protein B